MHIRKMHRSAIELLMSYPDTTVAEMLGVELRTVRRWLAEPNFARALRDREKQQRSSASRIARQVVISSASSLCQTVENTEKPDGKVLLEVLKASGAFEASQQDTGESLADVIRQTARTGGQSERRTK